MSSLDTNVLVRFLVKDDETQARKAVRRIEAAVRDDRPLFVPDIVLCETVWVLAACYDFGRQEIASALRNLFAARHLAFESRDLLIEALAAYAAGKGDFADYLIRAQARAAEQEPVFSFDKKLLGESGFEEP